MNYGGELDLYLAFMYLEITNIATFLSRCQSPRDIFFADDADDLVVMKSTTLSEAAKEIPTLVLDRRGREHGEQGASRL